MTVGSFACKSDHFLTPGQWRIPPGCLDHKNGCSIREFKQRCGCSEAFRLCCRTEGICATVRGCFSRRRRADGGDAAPMEGSFLLNLTGLGAEFLPAYG